MAADIALVTVSGQDRPGLMAQLTALLARHGASASHAIPNFGLDSVLYLMGFSNRDIDQALA